MKKDKGHLDKCCLDSCPLLTLPMQRYKKSLKARRGGEGGELAHRRKSKPRLGPSMDRTVAYNWTL